MSDHADRADHKDTNPKDVIADGKLPLSLWPAAATAFGCLAFVEGALKYGHWNFRVCGARMSVYLHAIERHLACLKDGEWEDPNTRVPHLSSILACAAIIADTHAAGTLVDDRPPASFGFARVRDALTPVIAHLKGIFGHHTPRHYSIADAVPTPATAFPDTYREPAPQPAPEEVNPASRPPSCTSKAICEAHGYCAHKALNKVYCFEAWCLKLPADARREDFR